MCALASSHFPVIFSTLLELHNSSICATLGLAKLRPPYTHQTTTTEPLPLWLPRGQLSTQAQLQHWCATLALKGFIHWVHVAVIAFKQFYSASKPPTFTISSFTYFVGVSIPLQPFFNQPTVGLRWPPPQTSFLSPPPSNHTGDNPSLTTVIIFWQQACH